MTSPPLARFDDLTAGTAVQFSRVDRVIRADHLEDVVPALAEVEQAVADGSWAAGMIAYEAAAGLNPDARTHPPVPGLPLVWFALAAAPDAEVPPPTTGDGFTCGPWEVEADRARHAQQVAAVRSAIAEGDTYQCNLTTRLRAPFTGDAYGLYGELAQRQRGAHHAYLDLGRFAVASASPEAFLARDGDEITTAPMKGTAPRGESPAQDRAARAALLASSKDRAENIMIVDLLRNDLSHVCEPGTVQVTDLLRCEQYPTLWQLTSRIRGRAAPGTGLVEMLRALFPCGSITGAPKLSTMDLIARLEDSPRGVYCGAIGYLEPGPAPRARFSVAIRTAVVDRAEGAAEYGAGGGVTWDSTAAGEYDELLVKARVLPVGSREAFALLETVAVRGGAPQHLEQHLERMLGSAAHFGIPVRREQLEQEVAAVLPRLTGPSLLRLRLRRDGTVTAEPRDLLPTPEPARLALDDRRTTLPLGLTAHKTTVRDHLAAARARHPGADDTVIIGEHGRVVETTIATLAVRRDGRWVTPPLADGALPGVGRRLALERGDLVEQEVEIDQLRRAEQIAVISSARGWRTAVLLP
ncbi:aminodeoxychorismate synthase component I [Brachybacterium sp. YJGR34]|uniref:aminodeoxychorismate synthase component I n=1 Tax=Brachybacterium sp. YJGR34 TaxID=2059911 RepID=UPI000E0AF276|nr:aminodeoxychorismate synthase component I [Brachybacterium sp. YJGR34]